MLSRKSVLKFSLLAYRVLLFLYPLRFRQQFGKDLLTTFEDWVEDECRERPYGLSRVWIIVLWELPLTAALEHADSVRRWSTSEWIRSTGWMGRVLALAAIPLFTLQVVLKSAIPWEEQFALWLGLVGLGCGAMAAQGQGTKCLFSATLSSMAGFGIGLVCGLAIHPPAGNWLGGVATLLAVVAVVALIGATYIRIIVEGLTFSSAATSSPGSSGGRKPASRALNLNEW